MTKNKKVAGILAGVLAVSLISGSFAYYTATHEVDNAMSTSKYGDTLTEVFTPKDDWKPGEEADKIVGVTNTGDSDIVVRIKMDETWTFGEGEGEYFDISSTADNFLPDSAAVSEQLDADDGLTAGDGSVVYKELDESDWTYNSTDGYWYYNDILPAGQSTGALLESITLCADTDMGKYTETTYYVVSDSKDVPADTAAWSTTNPTDTTELAEGQYLHVKSVSTLDSDKEGYADAGYVLKITSDTCQATADAIAATFPTAPAGLSWVPTV